MNSQNLGEQVSFIKQLGVRRLKLLSHLQPVNSNVIPRVLEGEDYLWLTQLMELPVSKLSLFKDNIWDYNEDVLNPPKSVQGAKLKLSFEKYPFIPTYVLTELKCLCYLIGIAPSNFSTKLQNTRIVQETKKNTLISHFEAGLRFINSVFEGIQGLGEEFIAYKFKSLVDVLDAEYRRAAINYKYTYNNELKQFFKYLTHPNAEAIFSSKIKIDFSSFSWPEYEKNKRVEKVFFENKDFDKLVSYSTGLVIQFLKSVLEPVEDKVSLAHFDALYSQKITLFQLSESLLNDYTVIRLHSKGHPRSYIEDKCIVPKGFYNAQHELKSHEDIRKIVKKKYNIQKLDQLRSYLNEVYYSCAYLIAQFTGMRPSEMSELNLSHCLIHHDGFDLIISNVVKSKFENLKLFDDKWVAIPILKDAIKAAKKLSVFKANDYLFSNMDTVAFGQEATSMTPSGIRHFLFNFLKNIFDEEKVVKLKVNAYMPRHTLAYQLHRIELGLPFISFQLKHIVDSVGKYTTFNSTSNVTLGYGEIAENIVINKSENKRIRRFAEIERVKTVMDPDGIYLGPKGGAHKARLKKVFQGYLEAGYSKDEVFNAMAEQGLAVINVGTGFCFGGVENFDESLPCIGSLRCNPLRCSNAVVTTANISKWREIYVTNKNLLGKEGYEEREAQLLAVIKEAKNVLLHLGERLE